MNQRSRLGAVSEQIVRGEFRRAEAQLRQLYVEASEAEDTAALDLVFSLFVELYSSMDPPDLGKAEEFSLQRERVNDTAHNRLQSALLLYHAVGDHARAVEKAREAVAKSAADGDDPTRYASLSLLGQVLLDTNRNSDAIAALGDIEGMIAAKKALVAGDETPFLEGVFRRGLEQERVRRIAAALEPLCGEAQFRKRLRNLM